MRLEPGADGMAWLTAHLPAATAAAAYGHLDALARTLPTHIQVHGGVEGAVATDPRSMDAKRADVLTSLLLGAAVTPEGTLTGALAVDQPCPGRDAHDLLGPGPYEPPERLKNLLRVRHRTCVFPGCTRPSRACELDHTVPYPAGPTCACNMAPLCVHHHHLKHQAAGWQLANHGNGHLTWTTPTGQHPHVGEPSPPPTPTNPDPPADHPDDPSDLDDTPPF